MTLAANKVGDARDPTARLQWESIDNSIYCLDEASLLVSAHWFYSLFCESFDMLTWGIASSGPT